MKLEFHIFHVSQNAVLVLDFLFKLFEHLDMSPACKPEEEQDCRLRTHPPTWVCSLEAYTSGSWSIVWRASPPSLGPKLKRGLSSLHVHSSLPSAGGQHYPGLRLRVLGIFAIKDKKNVILVLQSNDESFKRFCWKNENAKND